MFDAETLCHVVKPAKLIELVEEVARAEEERGIDIKLVVNDVDNLAMIDAGSGRFLGFVDLGAAEVVVWSE